MTADPGPGVDASGRPVIDPTENVLQLVEAANRRQDDLRAAESRHIAEMVRQLEARIERDWQRARELRDAEKERIDAIRAVDVAAVQTATAAADARAATLAAQVSMSAEAVRINLAAALDPLQKDIADLRRAQYEAQGVKAQGVEARGSNQWVVGFALSAFVALIAVVSLAIVIASN
jgi:hypothetical protein